MVSLGTKKNIKLRAEPTHIVTLSMNIHIRIHINSLDRQIFEHVSLCLINKSVLNWDFSFSKCRMVHSRYFILHWTICIALHSLMTMTSRRAGTCETKAACTVCKMGYTDSAVCRRIYELWWLLQHADGWGINPHRSSWRPPPPLFPSLPVPAQPAACWYYWVVPPCWSNEMVHRL